MSFVFNSENILKSTGLIAGAHNIVITSHKSPDGDAVGSLLSMLLMMDELGHNATAILPDEPPAFLGWMKGAERIVVFDQNGDAAKAAIAAADLIFVLDYNALHRTGSEMEIELAASQAQFIMIDHHQQPQDLPGVIYSDTSSCSTCQLIYEFFVASGWKEKINPSMAECLYCGIMTDSGSFRFPSVTPDTHRIVAEMMENGLDHAHVHREVYDTNSLDRLKLVGFALSEKLEVIESCATAIVSISTEELNKFSHRPGDTESLVNQALSIQGVKLAAFFREGNNEVKVSFRSKGNFDVNAFARLNWNGGGHRNAAGGKSTDDLETSIARFKNEIIGISDQIKNS
ncbi:MAG: DHH family phosphoesterase [Flavobacteriales bacterium]